MPSSPRTWENFNFEPSTFVSKIDNPFSPMKPDSRWTYRKTDAQGTVKNIEVTVTDQVKVILDVRAIVVHDLVKESDKVVKDTYDWFAQDRSSNVWYRDEDTTKTEGVNQQGSFLASRPRRRAGRRVVPGTPRVGMRFRQEYYKGHAEESAEILGLDASAKVPFGSFDHCLKTKDTYPLKPLVENKIFCQGVGHVVTTRKVARLPLPMASRRLNRCRYDRSATIKVCTSSVGSSTYSDLTS